MVSSSALFVRRDSSHISIAGVVCMYCEGNHTAVVAPTGLVKHRTYNTRMYYLYLALVYNIRASNRDIMGTIVPILWARFTAHLINK